MLNAGGVPRTMSISSRKPHADPRGRDPAGVVHCLEFVVTHNGLPGQGSGGRAGPEIATIREPVDPLGAGCRAGFELEAVLPGCVGLDVISEGGLGTDNPGWRPQRGGRLQSVAHSCRRCRGAGKARFAKLLEPLRRPHFHHVVA